MNKRNFEDILDECVARLQDGEPVDSILQSHQQDADRLRPLLRAAAHGQELPKPEANTEKKAEGKGRVIAAARSLHKDDNTLASKTIAVISRYIGRMSDWLKTLYVKKEKTEMKLAYRAVLYTLILVVIGGVFTVNTSAKSLPGEPLYGVKRGWERARLALTINEQSEQELEEEFEAERLEEVSTLVDERRLAAVEFEGTVDSIEDDLWTIGGFVVLVNQDTEINGDPGVGSRVEVEGHTQEDGTILAFELETVAGNDMDDDDDDMDDEDYEEQEAYGTLESQSGDSLVVDGVSYLINAESEVEDELQSGDYVKVKYYEHENGDLIALEVEQEDQDRDDDDDDMDDEDYEEQEAYGTLESLSDDSLVVDGVTYLIEEDAELEEDLAVGDTVGVEFYENEDGDLILLEVEVDDDAMATPSPTDEDDDDDSEDDEGDDDDDEDDEDDEDDGDED